MAIDAQPVRDVNLATGSGAIYGSIESFGILGSLTAHTAVGNQAPSGMDEAALKRLSSLALSARLRDLPMVMLPEEPFFAQMISTSKAAIVAAPTDDMSTVLLADVRAARHTANSGMSTATRIEQSGAEDKRRFASGTSWRVRPGSRPNSIMGPPADLMTEPKFVGPPVERANVPMFETPEATSIDDAQTPSLPEPVAAPPAVAVVTDTPPPPSPTPEAPQIDAPPAPPSITPPIDEVADAGTPPDVDTVPVLIAEVDETTEWPDDEYPDDEYPDDEYPDDEYPGDDGDGKIPPPVQVPEATTLLLVGIGLAVMALMSRRNRRRNIRLPSPRL